jgi:lipoate-protein ligase A
MKFIRIIDNGHGSAFYNMALDEAICEEVRKKHSPPTLRLYGWDRPSVSIGHFQKISEIDTGRCHEKGYNVVRRLTGGRAILHDSELTYSFSAPVGSPPFKGNLLENYRIISDALITALGNLNIGAQISFARKRTALTRNPSCFRALSFGEITVDGKKIIGSAQKRYSNGFLQQGSILFSFDPKILCTVLKGSKPEDYMKVGSLDECFPQVSLKDLKIAIKRAFEKVLDVKLIHDAPSEHEANITTELEKGKYSTHKWNFRR